MAMGRDGSNPIRLHDNEVSRRHAEVRPADGGRVPRGRPRVGQRHVRQQPPGRPGADQDGRPAPRRPDGHALQRGRLDARSRPHRPRRPAGQGQPRGPIGHHPEHPGRRRLARPGGRRARPASGSRSGSPTWPCSTRRPRPSATSPTWTPCLPQVLQLVFDSIGADRGRDPAGRRLGRTEAQGRPAGRGRPTPTSGWRSRARSSTTSASGARA